MKGRRHQTVIVLLMASVFLCLISSCGVPSYIIPKVVFSGVSSGDGEDSFTVSFTSDSLGTDGKVGLLLLYSIEDMTPVGQSALVTNFKNSYCPQYDGVPIHASDNDAIVSSPGYTLYALYGSSSRTVSAPDYSCAMDASGVFSSVITLGDYSDSSKSLSLSVDGVFEKNLYLDTAAIPGNYIGLYAAISVQSPQYSNIYWSQLSFVGYIKIN